MKMKIGHKVFNFWKENKVAGFFQLTDLELIAKFVEWLPTKDKAWLEYYGISEVVQVFVADGLNAVGNTEKDFAEYRSMEALLKPIRRNYLDKQTA